MQKCGNDKKNYHKCHLNGYNIEFDNVVLNFGCVHTEASYYSVWHKGDKTYQAYLTDLPSEEPELAFEATEAYC